MKCELLDESSEKLKVSFDKRMELLKAASKQRTREKDLLKENLPPAKKQKLQEDNLSSDPKKSPKKTIVPLEEAKSLENEEISDTEEESTSPEVSLNPSHTQPRKPPVGLKVRSNELFADLMGSGNSASNSVLRKEEINSPPHQGKIETLSEAMREICVLKKINNECKNKLRVKDNIILVKTKELQDLKVKYEEAIERNNKLQGEVIEGQKLVLEGLKNIKAAGIDKEPEMKIGFIDEEKGQVYMGYDKWITTNFYHKLMALPKIQLFVENVARFVFGDEVLLKSTVSGKTSNRSKNKSTEIYQLDPTSLSQTRGFFEHYLRNSVFTHGMHENIIFKHLGSLERYISKFIAKFKGNTIKTKTEKAVKEPTPPLRSNHDSEDEGEIQINNGVDGEMDDLNEEPDSEDSTAFIIDES